MKDNRPPVPKDMEKEVSEYCEMPVPSSGFLFQLEHELRSRHIVKERERMLEMKKKKIILTMGFIKDEKTSLQKLANMLRNKSDFVILTVLHKDAARRGIEFMKQNNLNLTLLLDEKMEASQ